MPKEKSPANPPSIDSGVVSIFGPPGSFKTTQALLWGDGHKVLFDFDLGAHRSWKLKSLVKAGLVTVHKIILPKKTITSRWSTLEGFDKVWEDFVNKFYGAFENPEVSTIILDTATIQWKLCCDTLLQELQRAASPKPRKQLQQMEYGEANRREFSLLSAAQTYEKYLILVHHQHPEYAFVLDHKGLPVKDKDTGATKSEPTGKQIPDGFKYIKAQVDWQFKTELTEAGEDYDKGVRVKMVIEKSAAGIDLVNMTIPLKSGDEDSSLYKQLTNRLSMLGLL